MSKKTIMLACAAGMSTSLLVTKMQQAAEKKELDVDILAVPVSEVDSYAKDHPVHVVLLGPQVRFMLKQFEEQFYSKDIPVAVIPMADYGMMNGEKVIELAEGLMK